MSVQEENISKAHRKEGTFPTLDALRRLRAPMRPRAHNYNTIDGLAAGRDAVPWYWKLVAIASSFMILGGFLMLPVTFEKKPEEDLRVSQAVVGIFAVALLTTGFSLTGLLCFAVRSLLFQTDSIFLPSSTSCALGLLTVIYNFLLFHRYHWNTPALLVTIAAAVGTVVYGSLSIWTQRKVKAIKTKQPLLPVPLTTPTTTQMHRDSESTIWQDATYYDNYNRNMFPSAYTPQQQPPLPPQPDTGSLTEEEMQRQQMLMLLLARQDPSTTDLTSSTFRIDWQGRDDEEPPAGGYYAPNSATSSAYPQTAHPASGLTRQWTNELRPWDGVWREVRRPKSQELRDARRREIEQASG